MEPLPELKDLRGKHNGWNDIAIVPSYESLPTDIKGGSLEILAEISPGDADVFGIVVSPNSTQPMEIGYDQKNKRLFSGDSGGSFDLVGEEGTLSLHIFIDRSVIEVYANKRACITTRFYPETTEVLGLSLFTRGAAPEVRSVDIWEMHSIW
jgi:sucrose-6-phosphate hydrolase SacC (GH32 family)